MTIPNLPTDNIYKFTALSGVVIVMVTMYFLLTQVAELELRTIGAREAVNIALQTASNLKQRQRQLEARISGYEKHGDATEADLKELRTLVDDLAEARIAHAIEMVKHEAEMKRLDVLLQNAFLTTAAGAVLLVLGFTLAITGFKSWYHRVQAPLDALLQKQLEGLIAPNGDEPDQKTDR